MPQAGVVVQLVLLNAATVADFVKEWHFNKGATKKYPPAAGSIVTSPFGCKGIQHKPFGNGLDLFTPDL